MLIYSLMYFQANQVRGVAETFVVNSNHRSLTFENENGTRFIEPGAFVQECVFGSRERAGFLLGAELVGTGSHPLWTHC